MRGGGLRSQGYHRLSGGDTHAKSSLDCDRSRWESQESQSANLKMIGSVERTRADSTYRNSDLALEGPARPDHASGRDPGAGPELHDAQLQHASHHDPHGNTWSSYWYNGHVYTNDGGRGVDVMRLPDKVTAEAQKLPHSNPQYAGRGRALS